MNIREKCVEIATCGPLGRMRFGGMIASLLAFPITFAMTGLYWLDHQSASIVLTASIFFIMIVSHIALKTPGEQDPSMIVVDRVIGLSIALMYISFSIKFFIVGFLLFHLLHYIFPLVMQSAWKIDIAELPGVLAVVTSSMVSGLIVQIVFRVLAWFIR
jgi:phosphatidylglycerophosphatase A